MLEELDACKRRRAGPAHCHSTSNTQVDFTDAPPGHFDQPARLISGEVCGCQGVQQHQLGRRG